MYKLTVSIDVCVMSMGATLNKLDMRIFDQHSTCGGEIIISRIEELLYEYSHI
jgi:hypothetical protein